MTNMTSTGTIVKKNSRFITLENGLSYSLPNEAAGNSLFVGQQVQFEYKENISKKNGETYRNIQGGVAVTGGAAEPQMSQAAAGRPVTNTVAPPPGEVVLDRQRSIIRQNSLTNAVNIHGHVGQDTDGSWEEYITLVINTAKRFEAYSTGDADLDEVAKLLEEKVSSESPQQTGNYETFKEGMLEQSGLSTAASLPNPTVDRKDMFEALLASKRANAA